MQQGAHGIVNHKGASQDEVIARKFGLVKHIRELGWRGGGVDLWGL